MQLSSSLLKPWAGPRQRHFPQYKTGPALGLLPCWKRLPQPARSSSPTLPNYPQINFNPLLFIFCGTSLHNSVVFAGFKHSLCSPVLICQQPQTLSSFRPSNPPSHFCVSPTSLQVASTWTDSPCAGVKIPQAATGGCRKQLGRLQSEHGHAAARGLDVLSQAASLD